MRALQSIGLPRGPDFGIRDGSGWISLRRQIDLTALFAEALAHVGHALFRIGVAPLGEDRSVGVGLVDVGR